MNPFLENLTKNNLFRYMVVGFTAVTIFCLIFYFAPYMILLGMAALFVALMSLAVGYIIVDSYDMWRETNDENKSGKTASSRKNVE